MRTQSICLALAIVLICSFASAQWMQTGGPTGGYVICVAAIGGTVCAGTGDGDIFLFPQTMLRTGLNPASVWLALMEEDYT